MDDEEARKARAERLRRQIRGIVEEEGEEKSPPSDKTKPESPREFVERRMRELDRDPKK